MFLLIFNLNLFLESSNVRRHLMGKQCCDWHLGHSYLTGEMFKAFDFDELQTAPFKGLNNNNSSCFNSLVFSFISIQAWLTVSGLNVR